MRRFNIRCYAIIINDRNELLLSDEFRFGHSFTKFVGGGLEFGEGTKECVQREIKEELGLESEIGELFYVNDFYQESAFNSNDQIVSFYYKVREIDCSLIPISDRIVPLTSDGESFKWISLDRISSQNVTFPIDKKVIEQLIQSK